MTSQDSSSANGCGKFEPTQWTMILQAARQSPDATQAFERLARAYWYPLYAFVCRRGRSEHDAKDLVQGFFAHLLEKDVLATVEPGRGKFRSFLLTCLRNYISNVDAHANAVVHGGGIPHLPIVPDTAATHCGANPAHFDTPDKQLDRDWALAVLEQTMSRLKAEQEAAGHARLFEMLSPRLTDAPDAPPYEDLAREVGMTVPAVRMAKSRLVERYRELLRVEVAQTVESPADVDEEIRHLFRALSS